MNTERVSARQWYWQVMPVNCAVDIEAAVRQKLCEKRERWKHAGIEVTSGRIYVHTMDETTAQRISAWVKYCQGASFCLKRVLPESILRAQAELSQFFDNEWSDVGFGD